MNIQKMIPVLIQISHRKHHSDLPVRAIFQIMLIIRPQDIHALFLCRRYEVSQQ